MHFTVRWPDGSATRCYSPSLVIKDFLEAGATYPLWDFVELSRRALTIGAERVREKYGFLCGHALHQRDEIEALAGRFGSVPDARVTVEGFDE
jgi:uncharacterized repeat protein (TIGR04042 family)